MNILILGTGTVEQKLISLCLKSRLLDHIYTASNEPLKDIPNVEYKDYIDLSNKAKALQADIVLVADKNLIKDGAVEILRKRMLNVISVNQKWFNLESSRIVAKQLMNYYSINNPDVIKAPVVFPIVIKTVTPKTTKVVGTMQELVEVIEHVEGEATYLEEFMKGEIQYLLSLWDGKNLVQFPFANNLTEVQEERLDLHKTKTTFMLSDEKADFIGFFTTKLIWAKNDWHVLEYIMHIDEKPDFGLIKSDFLYVLNLAIYQKLNELTRSFS